MDNKWYFSKSRNGFFRTDFHNVFEHSLPDDLVEITDEKHTELILGQMEGGIISSDDSGFPILIDPPAPSHNDEIMRHIRALESEVTPRRIREAFFDASWMSEQDSKIEDLRKQLK